MDSKIGLIIQFSGVLFVTTLLFLLTQSLQSRILRSWKTAWLCLLLALGSLLPAFYFEGFNKPFFFIYYFAEYLFCYFLISGCYQFSTEKEFAFRIWYFALPSFLIAVVLTFSATDFNDNFNLHTFLMGTACAVAFFVLKKNESARKNSGWRVMRVALAFLTLDFYHYTILFSLDHQLTTAYLAYNPVIDLLLQILLGFGMVIVLFEKVKKEAEETNRKLQEAHAKLEKLAHIDPLTTAFNRHAFYGFLHKNNDDNSPISGCVGFFDIDDLKPINDIYGHHIGDAVIRNVTSAIRSLMRAEDLIFRWGGDEFFVLMVGMDEELARQRMSRLSEILTNLQLRELVEPITVGVSYGFTNFADVSELESAIESADERMYQFKQARKREKAAMIGVISQIGETLNQYSER
jgi:diguanylate cyclase (GGDEF)-like protein